MAIVGLIFELLGTPAILLGIVALIGLLLQRKPVADVVSGTLKTVMGFIIMGVGAGALAGILVNFSAMFDQAFNVKGVIPNNEVVVAVAQGRYGLTTALVMVGGMAVNLLLARFTPLKYVFLTGHHILFMACLISICMTASGFGDVALFVVGSLALGACMVVFPAILQPYVRRITGGDDFAVGHFGSVGYLAAALTGRLAGAKSKSSEDIKVPKGLGFLRDTSVAVSLTMTALFIVVAVCAGQGYVEGELSGGSNFILFSLLQAVTFAAGVYVILAGVRMLIAEIVPAFKGISDRVVPEAKPALDCPTVFPFAPNAVILGFLSSFAAGLLSLFLLPLCGLKVIIPGLVPHFFTGATAGIFGNSTGGRVGTILGGFVNGLIISFLPAVLLIFMAGFGYEGATFGDSDFGVVGILLGGLAQLARAFGLFS